MPPFRIDTLSTVGMSMDLYKWEMLGNASRADDKQPVDALSVDERMHPADWLTTTLAPDDRWLPAKTTLGSHLASCLYDLLYSSPDQLIDQATKDSTP